jgi:hypothetical protein
MDDLAVCVEIIHTEVKIGDTLCVLPLITQLAGILATDVHVTGAFAEPVKPLSQHLPIRFATPDAETVVGVRVEIEAAYQQGLALNQHMAASICRLARVPVPELPITLDLAATPVGLPPGIVLSPFSGSKNPWYKAWPLERWMELTRHFVTTRDDPVYVLAASGEDAQSFTREGAVPLIALSLPSVLHLMRQAVLFISIDNGLSHLAHFGSVRRHLLIYPALLSSCLVVNPRAFVLRGRPEDISALQVICHATEMIERFATVSVA